jgi:phage portal protein BeeE
MKFLDRMKYATGTPLPQPVPERDLTFSGDSTFGFQNWMYALTGNTVTNNYSGVPAEAPASDFQQIVSQVYNRNGIVDGCVRARMMLITEARFKFRSLDDKSLYGTTDLLPLERPSPNQSSGDILARMEQDVSLAGNAYRVRNGRNLDRVRPDWMFIILGSNMPEYAIGDAPDATVVGYAYLPAGTGKDYKARTYLPSEVAHYAPEPDPLAHFRGRSWMRAILPEIDTDRQMTAHKSKFLERGVPPYAIKYPEEVTRGADGMERGKQIIQQFRENREAAGSWAELHLFGGADPVTLGINFRDLDFKSIQGAGETRIAMAARVPAAVLGISEGLAGSALNAGNFGQARRQFGEQYAYPSWRQMCEALAGLIQVPAGSELWYDTADVAFLREDANDAATVLSVQAGAIRTLVDGGFEETSVVKAITGGDLSLLKHTGLVPVQLQPPGVSMEPKREDPPNITVDARTNVAMPVDARSTIDLAEVTFTQPDFSFTAPEVRVDAPEITVQAPPPAEITVNVPELPQRTVKKTVQRDKKGLITGVTEEEVRG